MAYWKLFGTGFDYFHVFIYCLKYLNDSSVAFALKRISLRSHMYLFVLLMDIRIFTKEL